VHVGLTRTRVAATSLTCRLTRLSNRTTPNGRALPLRAAFPPQLLHEANPFCFAPVAQAYHLLALGFSNAAAALLTQDMYADADFACT
jgi:hypothetical protein